MNDKATKPILIKPKKLIREARVFSVIVVGFVGFMSAGLFSAVGFHIFPLLLACVAVLVSGCITYDAELVIDSEKITRKHRYFGRWLERTIPLRNFKHIQIELSSGKKVGFHPIFWSHDNSWMSPNNYSLAGTLHSYHYKYRHEFFDILIALSKTTQLPIVFVRSVATKYVSEYEDYCRANEVQGEAEC